MSSSLRVSELRYTYRAARPDGGVERGVIAATSVRSARGALRARGLTPIELDPTSCRSKLARLSTRELAVGLRMTADFLEAGLPMNRALELLAESSSHAWQERLDSIRDSIRQGRGFAESLASADDRVPPAIIGILRAGERGDGLSRAAKRAAEILEENESTRAAFVAAITYPSVLAIAGLASIGLLVGVVLPRFASLLTDLGQSLPRSTALLLDAAKLVERGTPALGVLAALGALAWWHWTSTASGREQWHAFLIATPLLGAVRHQNATAAACGTLGGLLESGLTLGNAAALAADTCGDAAVRSRVHRARARVLGGARLGHALGEERAFTSVATRLISAGEQSGRLGTMALHAARIERQLALQRTRAAVRFIEPAMVLCFGGLIAFVAAALLQAVYAIRPTP
jgi:general secretion pathway protein F